jgi:HEAT repeat protein
LIQALQDKDAGVRSEAANALGSAGLADASVFDALKAAKRDADADVREGAAASLAALNAPGPAHPKTPTPAQGHPKGKK